MQIVHLPYAPQRSRWSVVLNAKPGDRQFRLWPHQCRHTLSDHRVVTTTVPASHYETQVRLEGVQMPFPIGYHYRDPLQPIDDFWLGHQGLALPLRIRGLGLRCTFTT